jgi:hypothetical protein
MIDSAFISHHSGRCLREEEEEEEEEKKIDCGHTDNEQESGHSFLRR